MKGMHSALRNDFGIRDAAFNEKRTKWLRLNDFIPGFDRLEQRRVLPVHGFPEYVFGGLEHLGAPNRDGENTGWTYQAPQSLDRPVEIRDKKYAKDADDCIEGLVSKR